MTAATQKQIDLVPTKDDDLGAIPLEGSGFEDQQHDNQESGSEAPHG